MNDASIRKNSRTSPGGGPRSSPETVAPNWNKWVRQAHRWLSLVFTLVVVINIIAFALGAHADWVGLLAVLPLALVLPTGLYLFVLPHAARQRQ